MRITLAKIFICAFCLFQSLLTFAQTVAINEVMASNVNTLADEDGDYSDWIELYNYGDAIINLNGYGLSDNDTQPFKWVFPAITIQPGKYILVWASGKNRAIADKPLHTGFSIASEGEPILLTSPSGIRVDVLNPQNIPSSFSFGKIPNGTGNWRYFSTPTPGAINIGPGFGFLLSPPEFTHPDGSYSTSFNLEISTSHNGASIYYTTDGSEPTQGSSLYRGPITISNKTGVPNDISMIPTNNNDNPGPPYYEGWQPPYGEVFKLNVIRARVYHPDAPPSSVATYTYLIDPKGNQRYSLPWFSLNTDRKHLFSNETGIYVHGYYNNYFQEGDEWERPACLTFVESNGKVAFKEDIGIRLHGNTTRSRPRKSIRVSSRSEYGSSWINYRIFPDKDVFTYKRFLLRNSGNDWDWSVFRDGFIQHLAKNLNVETQYYRPSILFINGEYWGIHNIRDRYDEHYIQSHYAIAEDQMTILENNSQYKFGNPNGVDHYLNMVSFVNSSSMSLESNYSYVKTLMDIESFIDFQLTHIFSMNTDWPGNNTLYWRYLRDGYDPNAPKGKDGRWRWMILDTDFGFGLPFFYVPGYNEGPAHNTLNFAMEANGPSWPNPSWATLLLRRLTANQGFKYQFINRYCDLLNTTFSASHTTSIIDSISALLKPEMQEHINRWRRPTTLSEWQSNVEVMRSFARQRPAYQRLHLKQKFTLSDEAQVTVDVSNEKYGFVRINSINIKGETMGVNKHPYPWSGTYFKGVPIQLEAIPKPGYQFSHWSGVSSSNEPKITINLTTNVDVVAHFTNTDDSQLLHFWFFGGNLLNDTPLETIEPTYTLVKGSIIEYQSALDGYPFTSTHPNWRKASMERRNSPTTINYLPQGNSNINYAESNMRGVQVKQPFTGDGGENQMIIVSPTSGFKDIVFRFAAKDEGAAEGIIVEYSINSSENNWTSNGIANATLPITSSFQLYEISFAEIQEVSNNPNFRIRLRFYGSNMTADLGNRVTFNNFSIHGVSLTAFSIVASAGSNGSINPWGNIGVYQGGNQSFSIIPSTGYKILNVTLDGQSVLNKVSISQDGNGIYKIDEVNCNHTLNATFTSTANSVSIKNEVHVNIYPNPTKGDFIITSPSIIQKVELYNSMGMFIQSVLANTNELVVANLTPSRGIYLVKIYTLDGVVVKRVVVS